MSKRFDVGSRTTYPDTIDARPLGIEFQGAIMTDLTIRDILCPADRDPALHHQDPGL